MESVSYFSRLQTEKLNKNGSTHCNLNRNRIQEINEGEEQYLMGIRSLLHRTQSKTRSQTLPELNQDLISRLEFGLREAVITRDNLRREIGVLQANPPKQDRQEFDACLQQLRSFEEEATAVISETENELSQLKGFNANLSQTSAAVSVEKHDQLVNGTHNGDSVRMDADVKSSTETQKIETTRNNFKLRHSSVIERDFVCAVSHDSDARRFITDPEYESEYKQVKNSFTQNQVNQSGFLIGNLGIDSGTTRGSIVLKRPSISEQTRQARGLSDYLANNSTFKQYPITDPKEVRQHLPCSRDAHLKLNYWRVLKENVGRDVSNLALPIYMREPLTMNQKWAEAFEYIDLLRSANNSKDETYRLAAIASFFVMSIGQSKGRLSMPFNSVLNETFDVVWNDFKLIIETVCENPQTQAIYGECNDFIIEGTVKFSAVFSVSSFEFETAGKLQITLKSTKETYSVTRPKAVLSNFNFGDLGFWMKGDLKVQQLSSKRSAVVTFKPKGWSDRNDYAFEGKVTDEQGRETAKLSGRWDQGVTMTQGPAQRPVQIAEFKHLSEQAESEYNFSLFAVNLNHISTQIARKLPPSDSRWRADLRAYENGNIDLATYENYRIEEAREEHLGPVALPRWFELIIRPEERHYQYSGRYFESREAMQWPSDLKVLFE